MTPAQAAKAVLAAQADREEAYADWLESKKYGDSEFLKEFCRQADRDVYNALVVARAAIAAELVAA